jgi:hypothetical protein
MTSGGETLLATINPATAYDVTNLANKFTYDDPTVNPGVTYFYRVTTTNSVGEGPFCSEFQLNASCTDVALLSNLATAIPSTTYVNGGYPPESAINGDRSGAGWGSGTGGWNDNTRGAWPDTLEVDFNGSKTITGIRVYTVQNDFRNPVEPTPTTPADLYGLIDFDVQTFDGTNWVTVPGGSITGNDKAMQVFTLATPITTTKMRVVVNNARSNWSRITEVEAFTCP